MPELQLYLPLVGIVLFIVGAMRIFIKADITDGGQRSVFSPDETRDAAARARLLKTLMAPENRIDAGLMGLGVLWTVGFIVSITL